MEISKSLETNKSKDRTCQEVSLHSMTEHLYSDYLDKYKAVQAKILQVSQFDDSSAVSTTYLGSAERTRRDA